MENFNCTLYLEELVSLGHSKIGGKCPECEHKVSRHSRQPLEIKNTDVENVETTQKIIVKRQDVPNSPQQVLVKPKSYEIVGNSKVIGICPAPVAAKNNQVKINSKIPKIPTLLSKYTIRADTVLEIVQGDIVLQNLKAVVNAANEDLLHGTGVAGAIQLAGGPKLTSDSILWVKKNGKVRTGEVAVTTAGGIRGAEKVIHAVGPRLQQGSSPSDENKEHLRLAIMNSLIAANSEMLSSIAIPAISCGVFKFPLNVAASIHINAAIDFIEKNPESSLKIIRFVLYDNVAVDQFKSALSRIVAERSSGGTSSDNNILSANSSSANALPAPPPLPVVNKAQYHENSPVYIDNEKSSRIGADSNRFAAAGLLLYKFVKGSLRVLLGLEYRISDRGKVLNILGGKRDKNESTPQNTAAREFWEESGKIYSRRDILALIDSESTVKLWFGPGLYVLYLAKCPQKMSDVDVVYNSKKKSSFDGSAEMEKLIWVRWDYLINKKTINTVHPEYAVRAWRQTSSYPLSEFLVKLLKNEIFVKSLQQRCTIQGMIEDLAEVVNKEHERTSNEKISGKVPMPSQDWKFKAKLPTAKPVMKSPIVTLKPTDQEYITTIRSLPDPNKGQVVSIRKVEVEHQIVEHREEERRLGSKVTQIVNATYHGTPDTWRATSIAFKGFDLNLKLHGRACGDGVYTSTDINVPIQYTGGRGSILQLRGLLTTDDHHNNSILVFRGVKQVLPLYIIDFAVVNDENDTLAAQKALLQKNEEEKRLELVRESNEIREKEKIFWEEHKQRFINAHSYYYDVINNLKMATDSLLNDLRGSDLDIDTVLHKIASINRRFETERNQFRFSPNSSLSVNPIYVDKCNLLNAIKQNDIIVVSASTGSGKSTQLPQYVLDDVFDAAETRKVAVLEPRRCNVIDLCNRVSFERGENMGMEVGYSMGQGDICTSSATRIEFMTHGLFINRAVDVEKLLRTYGAVILDEAHERSVQVDFCFALLRRALEYIATMKSAEGNGISFKVIIASATLSEDQLERYKDYLSPNELPALTGCVYRIGGISFPVQIIYRPEAEPNWEQANSMEATSSLASYATEIALKLIQSSESEGNILIFMPGESVIDNCISTLSDWSIFKTNDDTSSIASVTSTKYINTIHLKIVQAGKNVVLNIGLYAFHGKISEASRRRMESHKVEGQDRIIIFSTNIAETGLTLPNIRYVVDTGLERRVEWNKLTCMQEMRTVRITKSSMNQRAGRAGRVASGICVRLYSKETADSLGEKGPEIENGMILSAVLMKHNIENEHVDNNKLTLLEEISEDGLLNAQKVLLNFGALDKNSRITEMGKKLLLLGVDLRLGRFLLACSANGCLYSGTNLAAIVSTSNCLSLLPRKPYSNTNSNYPATKYLDSSGDHLTLRNIFEAYDTSSSKSEFCSRYDLDNTILEAAARSRDNLSATLVRMDLADVDTAEVALDKELCRTKLLVSLCSAYFDQILSSNSPGKANEGFVRLVTVEERKSQRAAAVQIATFGGITKDDADDDSSFNDDDASTISDLTQDSNSSIASNSPTTNQNNFSTYDKVNISKNSSLWLIAKNNDLQESQQLGVFSSIMLTDSMRGMVAQLISYVLKEHIKEGASDWYEKTHFNSLAENLSINKRLIPLSSTLANYLMKSNVLKRNFNKFLPIDAYVNNATKMLEVSAPSFAFSHIERRLRKLEAENVEEENNIVINNISEIKSVLLLNFFKRGPGDGAQKKKNFVSALNGKILSGLGADEGFIQIHPDDIGIFTNTPSHGSCTVTLRLRGPSKQFSSLIIGEIQSEAARQCAAIELNYNSLTHKEIGSLVNTLAKKEERKKAFIANLNNLLTSNGCNIAFDIDNIGMKSDAAKPGYCTVYAKLSNHLDYSNTITEAIKGKVNEILRSSATVTPSRVVPTVTPGCSSGVNYPSVQVPPTSNLNIYLTQLSTSMPPPISGITDRNATMTFIAHAAIWSGKCSVYGGFIRDLLINGKDPNDIDIGYERSKIDINTIKDIVVKAASSINVRIVKENPSKGMAHAITFQGIGNAFDVDLVDMVATRANSDSPGVDCDVGNMVIEVSDNNVFGMQLKVKDRVSLLSLAISQKHCKEQCFVLYYSKDAKNVQGRLMKYFKRNWTCLTQLEEPLLTWAQNNGYASLLKPKAEFSKPFYLLP